MAHSQNVPVPYMSIQELWNDRRDPHANPLASSPRREEPAGASPAKLGGMVNSIYRPGKPEDVAAHYPLANKRLYGGSGGR